MQRKPRCNYLVWEVSLERQLLETAHRLRSLWDHDDCAEQQSEGLAHKHHLHRIDTSIFHDRAVARISERLSGVTVHTLRTSCVTGEGSVPVRPCADVS